MNLPFSLTAFSSHRFLKRVAAVYCFFILTASVLSCTKKIPMISVSLTIQKTGALIPLNVETAVTAAEQQQGFMHRKNIPEGTGMIFIYGHDTQLRFWMKDTPTSLSIAFIDSKGRIREIRDMAPYSLEIISSTQSVRYALEVPKGYFSRTGIGVGDCLTEESLKVLQERYHAAKERPF